MSHKGSRSKSGCSTCRVRKVRCDERPGVCLACEKLGLCCYYGTEAAAAATTPNPLKRKRTFRSCTICRATKTRCSGDRPCARCREKSLSCEYDDTSEPAWQQHLRFSMAQKSSPVHERVDEKTLQTDISELPPQHATNTPDLGMSGPVNNQVQHQIEEQPTEPTYTWHHRASEPIVSQVQNQMNEQPNIAPNLRTSEPVDSQMRTPIQGQPYSNTSWLNSWRLPDGNRVRILVEYYFANIHPLRCFGFLHKPSFIRRLDTGDEDSRDDDALLLVVCSLGALFYAAKTNAGGIPSTTLAAGNQWARRAQQLILAQLGNICVENLMAAILLHDYELRMANFGTAFMLSGLTARMAQALQINLEYSTDILCRDANSGPVASTKESRRRLMWCCYITDSLVGNGVDQLTLIQDADIKIQLPCNERNFLLESPCITEVLEPGQFLKFIPAESVPLYPAGNMGIRAYYLRFIAIRRKVLTYIKHLDKAKMPWLRDSEFAQLDAESRTWHDSLPASLQFNHSSIYIRKETSQLGALCALHYMYHQTMCDLYRIGAPVLYKLRTGFAFPNEQRQFLTYLQDELFNHARTIARITAEAFRHGPHAYADSNIPTIVYDCCRVILYYLTQLVDPAAERSKVLMSDTIPLVRSNVRALRMMQSMYSIAELLSNAAAKMLEKVGAGSEAIPTDRSIIPDEPYPNEDSNEQERSAPGTPVQSAPDYVLNPLSIYRMARKGIPEKHAPEKQPNATSPGSSGVQRRATLQHVPQGNVEPDASGSDLPPAPNPNNFTSEQAVFDDLLSLFTTDPSGWTWQPSDTAVGSQNEGGLPPWEPTYIDQQLDAWMPLTSQSQQQYGY